MTGSPLILLSCLFIGANAGAAAGPFDLKFSTVGQCPSGMSGENLLIYELKLKRVSRTKLIVNVNGTFLIPVSDELDIQVNLAKQTNQGWKDNFFILDVHHACSAFNIYIPGIEREIARQTNLKSGKCPFPAGNYSVSLPLNIELNMFPIFTYGKYRGRIFMLRSHSRVFCIETVVDVVPKKTG